MQQIELDLTLNTICEALVTFTEEILNGSVKESYNSGAIDVKTDGMFFRKNYLLRYWDCLSLLNWIEARIGLTLFITKIASRKIGALIRSIKIWVEVALYHYKPTIRS